MINETVLLLGDTHFGISASSEYFLNIQEDFFKKLKAYMDEKQIKTLIHLGDLYDTRKTVDIRMLNRTTEFFTKPFNESDIDVYIIVGNHDTVYKNTVHPNTPRELLYWTKFNIVDEPMDLTIGNSTFLLCPWVCDQNKDQITNAIKTSNADFCLGHFDIIGYEFAKGIKSHQGFDPSLFKRFNHVISGHYHGPSTINNITYIGTPYQLTWNDAKDTKRILLLNTNTKEIEEDTSFHQQLFHHIDLTNGKSDSTDVDASNLTNKIIKITIDQSTDLIKLNQLQEALNQTAQKLSISDRSNLSQVIDQQDGKTHQQASASTIDQINSYIEDAFKNDDDLSNILLKTNQIYNKVVQQ